MVFIEATLRRKQFEIIRETSKSPYLCYSILQRTKIFYHGQNTYRITETHKEVDVQALVDNLCSTK